MPRAPKKCAAASCETRGVGTYCPEHKPVGWSTRGASRTSTTEHKRWRLAVLYRDHWTCQIKGPRCEGRGAIADHILPVARRPDLEHDVSNGQAVCGTCHRTKTNLEAIEGRRGAPSPRPS